MTTHHLTPDLADEAAIADIEIEDIELNEGDLMDLDQWTTLMMSARDLQRRILPGVELFTGTAADGRLFRATVPMAEHVLVEFMDFAQRGGSTGSAANDDPHRLRRS
ncbi:MAG: hypothetical protein QM811_11360 [Pirellulales bacterium]